MKTNQKLLALFLLAGLVVTSLMFLVGDIGRSLFDALGGFDKQYYAKMKSIKLGMSEADVIKLLGQPDEVITDTEVKQYHGDQTLYGRPIANKNRVLVYYRGVDIIGHYFIDAEEKVVFVNVGWS